MEISRIRAMGLVRLAVGASLIAAPRLLTRTNDPSFALLVRTVGIRDVVLGAGSALSAKDGAALWGAVTLASDTLDVVAGAVATPSVGARGGLTAALVPVPFVAAGIWALRRHAPIAALFFGER
ncbi:MULTISPECIES: hypothetical protein [Nocardioides]|uniref:Uncharacterized protein n=1 Tax=Nocardioides vastitatis TaxID=2568655 RepID=A0ABW0ZEA0_9ACTN|nr:hypothetical protein [Nocardioides sp.]THI95295.1 hypothetical protein E7Z54_19570 [Nocardioides sp.]